MSSTLAFADRSADVVLTPSRRVAAGSALLAVACVLGLVEAALPGVPFAPWLRFGFANIAVVIALALFGVKMAAVVSVGRVGIVGLATGSLLGPTSVLAAAGALASLVAMWVLARHVPGTSPVGWSAAGSAAHVAAQLLAASVLLGSGSLLVLVPPSMLVALVLGALVGYLALIAASRLRIG
jgi:heptaprenyl diphosphate synthase